MAHGSQVHSTRLCRLGLSHTSCQLLFHNAYMDRAAVEGGAFARLRSTGETACETHDVLGSSCTSGGLLRQQADVKEPAAPLRTCQQQGMNAQRINPGVGGMSSACSRR